jgi:hypothetical protein
MNMNLYECTVNNEEKLVKSGFVLPNLKKDGKKEEFKNNKTYLDVPYFNLIFMWPMCCIWKVGHNNLDFFFYKKKPPRPEIL